MRQRTGYHWRRTGDKPLPETMLAHCQFVYWKYISIRFDRHSIIFIQENALEIVVCQICGHFVQGGMSFKAPITDPVYTRDPNVVIPVPTDVQDISSRNADYEATHVLSNFSLAIGDLELPWLTTRYLKWATRSSDMVRVSTYGTNSQALLWACIH